MRCRISRLGLCRRFPGTPAMNDVRQHSGGPADPQPITDAITTHVSSSYAAFSGLTNYANDLQRYWERLGQNSSGVASDRVRIK
jgi:hypothetical protein